MTERDHTLKRIGVLDCIKAGVQRYKDLQPASDFGLVEQEGTGTIVANKWLEEIDNEIQSLQKFLDNL